MNITEAIDANTHFHDDCQNRIACVYMTGTYQVEE